MMLQTSGDVRKLSVVPDRCSPWTGTFDAGPEGLSEVCATPNPDVVCVVAKGQGYWVPVDHPAKYEAIPSMPIINVFSSTEHGIIVFQDHTRLVGYEKSGFLWKTERLTWDGLEIDEVTDSQIKGTGWDSPQDCRVAFSVDLFTGQSEGGSSPPKY